ncbi:glycosyltransferase [Oxalobacter vibrioformis]|uniref:Glycosyltransferase n=1 Tax=Oxalobacter vibrioformis TaxID=933080 RepID=A0A9E9P3T5_9BURK|nr:glycosyltransferase [Oxalobacter vibrioformis]WAW10590.1 glycosyltransferase [Oxalobacter vibrioformis]
MRIIQVIRSLTFGGAENHVLSLSLGLREMGHDVLVVGPKNSWISDQCTIHQLPMELAPMRGIADVTSYWKLHRLIKFWKADIAHAHQVRPSQYVGIATMGTKAVPVSTVHSTSSSKHMRRCRHLIAVADAVEANLVRHHYPKEIITRIYNGVPDMIRGERDLLRQELAIPDEQFAVVLAGRFHRDKGQDLLVEIARLSPENVHIYFLGDTETGFGHQVIAMAEGHPRIHFLGYRNDVQRILPAFDVYAAPSRREAFSLSLVEAGAASLPVVGMQVGGIPEGVLNGETGILVPPGDISAFADAIQRLAFDKALSAKLGTQARQRYKKEFTVEHMLEQTERVYKKLLGKV